MKTCPAIRSLNSTICKKVRRYLLISFRFINFFNFVSKIFNYLFNAWETVNRNPRLDRRFLRAVQRLAQTSGACDETASDGDLNIFCITNYLSSN